MPSPTITALSARAVNVPFRLKPHPAGGPIDSAPLVLIDLHTDAGITGRAYLFVFGAAMLKPTVLCIEALADRIVGATVNPLALDQHLRQGLRLLDTHGILGQALAGIDMAVWDIHAQVAGMPLAQLLGAGVDGIAAYNSCGLWLESAATLADQALELVDEGGFRAVKLRLGRPDPRDDLAVVQRVRASLPDDVLLMSDYNQSLSVNAAIERGRMLDDEGLYWIEEPVAHDDYHGCARVRAALNTPIQLGENLRSISEMSQAIAADAGQFYMPDVQRIGGVSGWLKAASLAASHSLDLSSHLFPEISVHLLAASESRHWLEYVDWANPILATPLVNQQRFRANTRPPRQRHRVE